MQTITINQLAAYLEEYDQNKGSYRNNFVTSWIVGADQHDITKLKTFFTGLINAEVDRPLYSIELFQLARIIVDSKTTQGSLSDTVFEKLKDLFGKNVISGLAVLNEHHAAYKLFTEDNFNKVAAANDPLQAAKVITALHILHASELRCRKIAELRPQVESHSSPIRLAEGIKGVSMTGYKFNTEENLQKVLSSGDPLKTAEEIVFQEVAPGFDPINAGYFPKLNLTYHMSWSTVFSAMRASSGAAAKKDHGAETCRELLTEQPRAPRA